MSEKRLQCDIFIAGGGPAGLAAAIAARQKGFSVIVADYARPPIDKACGEGLMPDAVLALSRLGITFGFNQGIPFRGIRFTDGKTSVTGRFPHGHWLGNSATYVARVARPASHGSRCLPSLGNTSERPQCRA